MRNLCLAILACSIAACAWPPWNPQPPQPTPTPAPPWECELEMPGCHETGATCSSPDAQCWHNPTSSPEHCEEAPACPDPPPVEPPPIDPPPVDPPPTGCVHEPNLVSSTCFEQAFRLQVKSATNELGDRCGTFWKLNLEALAAQLRVQLPDRCIIAGIEAIFIQRDDGKYEENHAVASDTGCWTNSGFGKYIGCHIDVDGGEPPVEPPPGDGVCVDPDPTGLPAEFVMKPHGAVWDTTYRVKGFDYCTAAGFTNRTWCPLRNEGDPERPPCEAKHIGVQQWWCDGANINARSCDVFEDDCVTSNPAQAKCQSHAKTCTEDGRTCAEADW